MIGLGSIGSRHVRVLQELGCTVAVVTRRRIENPRKYHDITTALREYQPEYAVIANSTNQHYDALMELARENFRGNVLVEKPLFEMPRDLPPTQFRRLQVAYNLRFHPVILKLKSLLIRETIISVNAYVGQYLPDWRPKTDYRRSYSASQKRGGGALRDLSHELDYLSWLFGDWSALTALGGHFSSLEIDSDDLFILIMEAERCPVITIQLSYLDRMPHRRILINTENHHIDADLIKSCISVDGKIMFMTSDRDHTYREMHKAIIEDRSDLLCTVEQGNAILNMINMAEQANQGRIWIRR